MSQSCRSCHRDFPGESARFCPFCGARVDLAATLLFGGDPARRGGASPEEIARFRAAIAPTVPRTSAPAPAPGAALASPACARETELSSDSGGSASSASLEANHDGELSGSAETFGDDELFAAPRRSLRAVWLAAGAVVLVVATWTVASATRSHAPAAETPGEGAPVDENPALAAALGEPPAVAAEPGQEPPQPVVAADASPRDDSAGRKRRARSRRSRSSSRRARLVESADSLQQSARSAATSLQVGLSPAATLPRSAAPAAVVSRNPSAAQPPAPATSAPSSPARATDHATEQPIDPFAGGAPAASGAPSEQPIDPFGPERSPAAEQPVDPFAADSTGRPNGQSNQPAGEQPIDPVAASDAALPADRSGSDLARVAQPAPESESHYAGDPQRRAQSFVNAGNAHLAAGRHSAAQASFARALGLDPTSRAALEGLAAARQASGR